MMLDKEIIMESRDISKAALGRVPAYLKFLLELPPETKNVSATIISKGLGLGDVQVRKDLQMISGSGRPRTGYDREELTACLKEVLSSKSGNAVIVGAGKLGTALLDYLGFEEYGVNILAAFDKRVNKAEEHQGKMIYPVEELGGFIKSNDVKIGIIAVPAESAQNALDLLTENGIKLICSFAPRRLEAPDDVIVQYENLALSLAHLKYQTI